jgi:hypothetical protein
MTEESAHPQRGQPFELGPTADDCPYKTDNRPEKKRSRMSQLGSQVLIRGFRMKIFRRRSNARFAHYVGTGSVRAMA